MTTGSFLPFSLSHRRKGKFILGSLSPENKWRQCWGLPYMTSTQFWDRLTFFPSLSAKSILRKFGEFFDPLPPSVWTSYMLAPLAEVHTDRQTRGIFMNSTCPVHTLGDKAKIDSRQRDYYRRAVSSSLQLRQSVMFLLDEQCFFHKAFTGPHG